VEDEEEDICFAIAFSILLLTVFEFSFVSLYSLYLFENPWATGGVLTKGFSPHAIKTKACRRLSAQVTESISPLTSDLVQSQFPRQPRAWCGSYFPAKLRLGT
jgi:hypothetical protein